MDKQSFLSLARPVTIDDQAVFDRYYTAYPQTICEYTFAQMLLWGESRKHLWCEIDGHLVVSFQKTAEERQWYQPIGPSPAGLIAEHLSPINGFSYLYVYPMLQQHSKIHSMWSIRLNGTTTSTILQNFVHSRARITLKNVISFIVR